MADQLYELALLAPDSIIQIITLGCKKPLRVLTVFTKTGHTFEKKFIRESFPEVAYFYESSIEGQHFVRYALKKDLAKVRRVIREERKKCSKN